MLKKFLSLAILLSIVSIQCNFIVYAAIIEDDIATLSIRGQNISKRICKNEIIKDDIEATDFKKEQLIKAEIKKDILEDKTAKENLTISDLSKPTGKYKLIDENDEVISVEVSPIDTLNTKKGLNLAQEVNFKVINDVKINNEIFIQKDTPVKARIETITKSSMGGDPYELTIGRFTTKDIDGNKIALVGELNKKGADRAKWIKPLAYIGYCVPVFGTPLLLLWFIKGGQAKITPIQKFKLYYE